MAFTKNNTSISSSLYLRPMFPQYVDAEIYGVDWPEKKTTSTGEIFSYGKFIYAGSGKVNGFPPGNKVYV